MIIEIYQNNIPTRRVQPDTPIRLYAGGYPWNWFAGAHFQVKDSSGYLVLDKANIDINLLRNCWLDWTAPHSPGWYYFIPYADDPNTFIVFEVASDAVIPGDPQPDPEPDPVDPGTGSDGLQKYAIPLAIGTVIAVLLWPKHK